MQFLSYLGTKETAYLPGNRQKKKSCGLDVNVWKAYVLKALSQGSAVQQLGCGSLGQVTGKHSWGDFGTIVSSSLFPPAN